MAARVASHLRGNLVAYVALFLALGLGTAWALERNSVRSKHIRDGHVREPDVGLAAITPAKVDLLERSAVAATASTSSTTPADLSSFGPSVTVDVPADSLVAIYARVTTRLEDGSGCVVHLAEATLPGGTAPLMFETSGSFVTRHTTPGTATGTPSLTSGGWIVFPASEGSHSYSLQYSASGVTPSCTFQDRQLYVAVVA